VSLFINCDCPYCSKAFREALLPGKPVLCSHCGKGDWLVPELEFLLKLCFICGCEEFFRQKNFNKILGCSVILIGIILMPWTFGLSLPLLALVDWVVMSKWVKDMGVCYQCRTEFIGVNVPKGLGDFNHFKAFKYERLWAEQKKKFNPDLP